MPIGLAMCSEYGVPDADCLAFQSARDASDAARPRVDCTCPARERKKKTANAGLASATDRDRGRGSDIERTERGAPISSHTHTRGGARARAHAGTRLCAPVPCCASAEVIGRGRNLAWSRQSGLKSFAECVPPQSRLGAPNQESRATACVERIRCPQPKNSGHGLRLASELVFVLNGVRSGLWRGFWARGRNRVR